jgi:NAD(P)-dependent dehydrogenase (short-subunit alcohol dehydrogenase family)
VAGEDDRGLDGKVAIVTGAGALDDGIGNGRAAAILLARAGARVLVVDRVEAAAARTVAMIEAENGLAMAATGDVTVEADCRDLVAHAVDTWGRLDVLDNNVGIGSRGSVVDEDPDRWDRVMEVNVRSMFLMSRHAVPAMAASGGGAIVNISSIAALRPGKLTAYTTSKGAVISLTKAMAVDHARDGVRVNCVAPGPVYTPMVYGHGMPDELRQARRNASLLKVEGTGWDIGNAVVFLSSDQARYITGQTLVVDGGVTLSSPPRR